MWHLLPPSKAQAEYDGPDELRLFADILPYLGELVISFSRLERRISWAIESLLCSTRDEADELEQLVQNLSARVSFLELTARPVARQADSEPELVAIISDARAANTFRNRALHNAFVGVQVSSGRDGEMPSTSAIKGRYNIKAEKRSYAISTNELRAASIANLQLETRIHRWIMTVRQNAENRVP